MLEPHNPWDTEEAINMDLPPSCSSEEVEVDDDTSSSDAERLVPPQPQTLMMAGRSRSSPKNKLAARPGPVAFGVGNDDDVPSLPSPSPKKNTPRVRVQLPSTPHCDGSPPSVPSSCSTGPPGNNPEAAIPAERHYADPAVRNLFNNKKKKRKHESISQMHSYEHLDATGNEYEFGWAQSDTPPPDDSSMNAMYDPAPPPAPMEAIDNENEVHGRTHSLPPVPFGLVVDRRPDSNKAVLRLANHNQNHQETSKDPTDDTEKRQTVLDDNHHLFKFGDAASIDSFQSDNDNMSDVSVTLADSHETDHADATEYQATHHQTPLRDRLANIDTESGSIWPDNRFLRHRNPIKMVGHNSRNLPVYAKARLATLDSMEQLRTSGLNISRLHLINLLDKARAPHNTYHAVHKWLGKLVLLGMLAPGKAEGAAEILEPAHRRTFMASLRRHFNIALPQMVKVPMETRWTRKALFTPDNPIPGPNEASGNANQRRAQERERLIAIERFERTGRDVATVPLMSFGKAMLSLLNCDIWRDPNNLVVNPTEENTTNSEEANKMFMPYTPDPESRMGEYMGCAGAASIYRNLAIDPVTEYAIFVPIYGDKTGHDQSWRYASEPFLCTILNFKAEIRDDPRSWRPFGFIPDHELRSSAEKARMRSGRMGQGVGQRNYHRMLQVLTDDLRSTLQEADFRLELRIGDWVAKKRLVFVVSLVTGDLKSIDTITLRYSTHSAKVPRQMVGCYCAYDSLDKCGDPLIRGTKACVPVWSDHLHILTERAFGHDIPRRPGTNAHVPDTLIEKVDFSWERVRQKFPDLPSKKDEASKKAGNSNKVKNARKKTSSHSRTDANDKEEGGEDREEDNNSSSVDEIEVIGDEEDSDSDSNDDDQARVCDDSDGEGAKEEKEYKGYPSKKATLLGWEDLIKRILDEWGIDYGISDPPSYEQQDAVNEHLRRIIKKMSKKEALYLLSSIAQSLGNNAFRNVDLGGIPGGLNSIAPADPMHGFLLGVLKYIIQVIFENLSPNTKAEIDRIADRVVRLQKQQDRAFYPRCDFSYGISNLTNITAKEWLGIAFTLVIILRSRAGRVLFENNIPPRRYVKLPGGKRRMLPAAKPLVWNDVLLQLEQLLCFYDLLHRGPFWKHCEAREGARCLDDAIRTMMRNIMKRFPRDLGNGWKLTKFHQLLRIAKDMYLFGEPYGYDTMTGERLLKTFSKWLASTAQMRGYSVFLEQLASRSADFLAQQEACASWLPEETKPYPTPKQLPSDLASRPRKQPEYGIPLVAGKVVQETIAEKKDRLPKQTTSRASDDNSASRSVEGGEDDSSDDRISYWWFEGVGTTGKSPMPFSRRTLEKIVQCIEEEAPHVLPEQFREQPLEFHIICYGETRVFPGNMEIHRPVEARRYKRFQSILDGGLLVRSHPNYRSKGRFHDWVLVMNEDADTSVFCDKFQKERERTRVTTPLKSKLVTGRRAEQPAVVPAQVVTGLRVVCNARVEVNKDLAMGWSLDATPISESVEWDYLFVLPCDRNLDQDSVLTSRWQVACETTLEDAPGDSAALPVLTDSVQHDEEKKAKEKAKVTGERRVSKRKVVQEAMDDRVAVLSPDYALVPTRHVLTRVLAFSEGNLIRDTYPPSTPDSDPEEPEVTVVFDREQSWGRAFKDFLDPGVYGAFRSKGSDEAEDSDEVSGP